jgi:hypothetical protein
MWKEGWGKKPFSTDADNNLTIKPLKPLEGLVGLLTTRLVGVDHSAVNKTKTPGKLNEFARKNFWPFQGSFCIIPSFADQENWQLRRLVRRFRGWYYGFCNQTASQLDREASIVLKIQPGRL